MEANYKFSITDALMDKMQKDVEDLEEALDDSALKKPTLSSKLYDIVEVIIQKGQNSLNRAPSYPC